MNQRDLKTERSEKSGRGEEENCGELNDWDTHREMLFMQSVLHNTKLN
jgi:hypothetical protein